MIDLTITIYSHHFSVTNMTDKGKYICTGFSYKLVQYGFVPERGQMIRKPLRVFASSTYDKSEFRFHINSLQDFKEHLSLKNCRTESYYTRYADGYEPAPAVFTVKPEWVPRDYQVPIIEYLIQPEPISKLVGIRTGQGKGVCALLAMARIGLRTAIIIKPAYIEKWIDDVSKTYELEKDDVCLVKGSAALMNLIAIAQEDKLNAKIIIISNTTFNNWLKLYETYKEMSLDMGYGIKPYEFFSTLKIGVRLIDEIHQHFHGCFKTDLYTDVKTSIALSATMITDDPFIDKMHKLAYPLHTRYKDIGGDKYINSYAVHYRFNRPDFIRTTEFGSNNFSMSAVEKSIMKHVPTLRNYFDLICYIMDIGYMQSVRSKKRLLIFAYSVDMITSLVNHLRKKYPSYDIRRYVMEDDYDNLMQADICVSTLGSSGTAVDIPDLVSVILTTSINSIAANVQSLGRLRKLDGNTPVCFHYLVCDDIPKSVEYHLSKKEMLKERAATFLDIYSGYVI